MIQDAVTRSVLEVVRTGRIGELRIDDLTTADLDRIAWSGNASHIRSVRAALERTSTGEVAYLAVRAPGGEPIAKGGIDYAAHPGAGTLWQLSTHPSLQSLGLGTRLIAEAERRIRRHDLRWAVLGVEDNNPRARALYERLGYAPWKREPESWPVEAVDGTVRLYQTEVLLLRKRL